MAQKSVLIQDSMAASPQGPVTSSVSDLGHNQKSKTKRPSSLGYRKRNRPTPIRVEKGELDLHNVDKIHPQKSVMKKPIPLLKKNLSSGSMLSEDSRDTIGSSSKKKKRRKEESPEKKTKKKSRRVRETSPGGVALQNKVVSISTDKVSPEPIKNNVKIFEQKIISPSVTIQTSPNPERSDSAREQLSQNNKKQLRRSISWRGGDRVKIQVQKQLDEAEITIESKKKDHATTDLFSSDFPLQSPRKTPLSPEAPLVQRPFSTSRVKFRTSRILGGIFGRAIEDLVPSQYPESEAEHELVGVPFILVCICDVLLEFGVNSEGIFRIPANEEDLQSLKNGLDLVPLFKSDSISSTNDQPSTHPYLSTLREHASKAACPSNLLASLLKLFLREFPVALIPFQYHTDLLSPENLTDFDKCSNFLIDNLPKNNYSCLKYLITFLQTNFLTSSETMKITKMESAGLSVAFGPCLFGDESNNLSTSNPSSIIELSKKMTNIKLITKNILEKLNGFKYTSLSDSKGLPIKKTQFALNKSPGNSPPSPPSGNSPKSRRDIFSASAFRSQSARFLPGSKKRAERALKKDGSKEKVEQLDQDETNGQSKNIVPEKTNSEAEIMKRQPHLGFGSSGLEPKPRHSTKAQTAVNGSTKKSSPLGKKVSKVSIPKDEDEKKDHKKRTPRRTTGILPPTPRQPVKQKQKQTVGSFGKANAISYGVHPAQISIAAELGSLWKGRRTTAPDAQSSMERDT